MLTEILTPIPISVQSAHHAFEVKGEVFRMISVTKEPQNLSVSQCANMLDPIRNTIAGEGLQNLDLCSAFGNQYATHYLVRLTF
jgi:hypothetical protein